MVKTFDELIADVLRREGGYVDHPADRGGATNMGITQRSYNDWRERNGQSPQSVRLLTHAETVSLYHANYWQAARCDDVPPVVRAIHFDAAVNHGVHRAARLLQVAARVTPDGVIGRDTLAALATQDAELTRARYLAARYRLYGDIVRNDRKQIAFIVGWLSRLAEFQEA